MCQNPLKLLCFVIIFRLKQTKISPKIYRPKKLGFKRNFASEGVLGTFYFAKSDIGQKIVGQKRSLVKKKLLVKKILGKKNVGPKKVWSKRNQVQIDLGPKKSGFKKIFGPKIFGSK